MASGAGGIDEHRTGPEWLSRTCGCRAVFPWSTDQGGNYRVEGVRASPAGGYAWSNGLVHSILSLVDAFEGATREEQE